MLSRLDYTHPARRLISGLTAFVFIFSMLCPLPAGAAPGQLLGLPAPGAMVLKTSAFAPALIRGVRIDPDNPLAFNFIIDTGDSRITGPALKAEASRMIKYFLAALTVPEDQIWVNLSPYEGNRIVGESLGRTEMGRDLLAQDYLLKQLSASLLSPEQSTGKDYWQRVYKRAQDLFGTTNVPVDTFNKIWIVPQEAVVYEDEQGAYVGRNHLKVMLEADYLALEANLKGQGPDVTDAARAEAKETAAVTADVVRDVLLPEIEAEVNNGETFANLRQMYHAMILATWYKTALKESLLGQVYANQNKTRGVDLEDPSERQAIYDQYLEAFRVGVYDAIKEDLDPVTQQVLPRRYFSGGFGGALSSAVRVQKFSRSSPRIAGELAPSSPVSDIFEAETNLLDVGPNSSPAKDLNALVAAVPTQITSSPATPRVDSPFSWLAIAVLDAADQTTNSLAKKVGEISDQLTPGVPLTSEQRMALAWLRVKLTAHVQGVRSLSVPKRTWLFRSIPEDAREGYRSRRDDIATRAQESLDNVINMLAPSQAVQPGIQAQILVVDLEGEPLAAIKGVPGLTVESLDSLELARGWLRLFPQSLVIAPATVQNLSFAQRRPEQPFLLLQKPGAAPLEGVEFLKNVTVQEMPADPADLALQVVKYVPPPAVTQPLSSPNAAESIAKSAAVWAGLLEEIQKSETNPAVSPGTFSFGAYQLEIDVMSVMMRGSRPGRKVLARVLDNEGKPLGAWQQVGDRFIDNSALGLVNHLASRLGHKVSSTAAASKKPVVASARITLRESSVDPGEKTDRENSRERVRDMLAQLIALDQGNSYSETVRNNEKGSIVTREYDLQGWKVSVEIREYSGTKTAPRIKIFIPATNSWGGNLLTARLTNDLLKKGHDEEAVFGVVLADLETWENIPERWRGLPPTAPSSSPARVLVVAEKAVNHPVVAALKNTGHVVEVVGSLGDVETMFPDAATSFDLVVAPSENQGEWLLSPVSALSPDSAERVQGRVLKARMSIGEVNLEVQGLMAEIQQAAAPKIDEGMLAALGRLADQVDEEQPVRSLSEEEQLAAMDGARILLVFDPLAPKGRGNLLYQTQGFLEDRKAEVEIVHGIEGVRALGDQDRTSFSLVLVDDSVFLNEKVMHATSAIEKVIGPIPKILLTGSVATAQQNAQTDYRGYVKVLDSHGSDFVDELLESSARAILAQQAVVSSPAQGRILLVDDNDSFRETLVDVFEVVLGVEVIQAENGVDALKKIQELADQGKGDGIIIITDREMPEMNGIDFARAVRNQGFQGPILLQSGTAVDDIQGDDLSILTGVFHKARDYEEVMSTIKTLLSEDKETTSSPVDGKTPVGGIDLDAKLLDLQIRRDGRGVPLPLPQQSIADMHIEGFIPVILNITPLPSLPMLLGMATGADDEDQTAAGAARDQLPGREPEELSWVR